MRKLAWLLMATLIIGMLSMAPAAFAEGVVLPDLADYMPEDIQLLDADDANRMRLYYCADEATAYDSILLYAFHIFELHGFDNIYVDDTSSDNFVYIYIATYNGSADIAPDYMDDCPEPCYMLFGVTGYDGGVLIATCVVDGIIFGASADTGTDDAYILPVVGSDGLLVMPMEEYFTDIERSYMFVEDQCYGYRYTSQGRYYDGNGSDEYREMYVQYVNDLVATGYYTLLEHYEDKTNETWRLGYTGDVELETFRIWKDQNDDAAIVVDLLYDDGRVYYSYDIATTNFEEAAIESGLLDDDWNDDNSSSWDDEDEKMECPRCWGSGESKCTSCWGTGQVTSHSTSSGRETCGDCRGRGRDTCGYCNGRGTIN